jgi:hypothetical protein
MTMLGSSYKADLQSYLPHSLVHSTCPFDSRISLGHSWVLTVVAKFSPRTGLHSKMEPSSGAGGGRGRANRGGRSRRKNVSKGGVVGSTAPKKSGVPPPPQLKLAMRHIGNPVTYGTTKAVLEELLIPLIDACNAKASQGVPSVSPNGGLTVKAAPTAFAATSFSFFLEMDATAKRHLIDEEEAVQKYLKEWEQKQDAEEKHGPEIVENDVSPEGTVEEGDGEEAVSDGMVVEQETTELEVLVAPATKPPPGTAVITVRPLVVIPPKRSHRRGDRPGVAYLLLTAPKIEKIAIPETVPEKGIPAVVGRKPTKGPLPEPVATTEDAPKAPSETEKVVAKMPSSDSVTGKTSSVVSAKKQADYSRQVAHGRLLLQTATDLLVEMTSSMRPSRIESGIDQSLTDLGTSISIQIEPAMSGKTWRWQSSRSDRRENTLETTSDYKSWLAGVENQVADLKARPKPAPGGGAPINDETINTSATVQPISALVQHLLSKQQEMKRSKVKKKDASTNANSGVNEGKAKTGKGGTKNLKKGKSSAKSEGTTKQPKGKPPKKKGLAGSGNSKHKAVAPAPDSK